MADRDKEKTNRTQSMCHLQWPTSRDLYLAARPHLLNDSRAFKIGPPAGPVIQNMILLEEASNPNHKAAYSRIKNSA